MDQALLEVFGKAAGIGGLALAVFLLIFRSVIRKNIFPKLHDENAYRLIRLMLVLTFLISALGIGAWIFVTIGTASSPQGAVDEPAVKKAFQEIGGTGWILLGNYDFAKNQWTFGPFFDFVHANRDIQNGFPAIGDTIRVTATRHLIILDWHTEKWKRRLQRPGLDKGTIGEDEDYTPSTLGAGALVDIGDVSAGHFPGRQDVVWARVIPMVH
jgi:hypothetical protein